MSKRQKSHEIKGEDPDPKSPILTVLFYKEGSYWIAQGLENDLVTQGNSLEDAKKSFVDALVTLSEYHIKRGTIPKLRPSPIEVLEGIPEIVNIFLTSLLYKREKLMYTISMYKWRQALRILISEILASTRGEEKKYVDEQLRKWCLSSLMDKHQYKLWRKEIRRQLATKDVIPYEHIFGKVF